MGFLTVFGYIREKERCCPKDGHDDLQNGHDGLKNSRRDGLGKSRYDDLDERHGSMAW